MDGLSFLRSMPAENAAAVVVVSSLGQSGCSAALQALEAGAVDVIAKPAGLYSVADLRFLLPRKIRAAYHSRRRPTSILHTPARTRVPAERATVSRGPMSPVTAIGASTGGTEAVREILSDLPAHSPPILIVQHIPPLFSRAFAERLNRVTQIRVAEASDGQSVEPGLALIAPGDQHMLLQRSGGVLKVSIRSGPRVCYQRPSVDVLFRSVAETAGGKSIGVILTGMGTDGAEGLLRMREAGARTIAQDESTCVVYGMPKEAIRVGAVQQVLPLANISDAICVASGI
jgi:two-component system, chemotaxis family, protein-glutamate methylesterase/glutaminase